MANGTVNSLVSSLNSNMPTVKSVSTGISNVTAYIYGRVAFLLISYTCEASKGWQTIGTLQSGLRPINDMYISVAMTSTDNAFALVQIRSNGIIRVYNPNTTANPIGGSATYITYN